MLTYLLHTFGELCLSPVGLSSMTKLAPPRFVGQMMGIWFLATRSANLARPVLAATSIRRTSRRCRVSSSYLFWWGVIAGAVMRGR